MEEAQENESILDDFEFIQKAYTNFEMVVTNQIEQKRHSPYSQMHRYLTDLNHLPTLPLHSSAKRIQQVVESYLLTLQTQTLSDLEMVSTQQLMENFKQRLFLKFHQEITSLMQKAIKLNGLEVLKDIQNGVRLLQQQQFPDVDVYNVTRMIQYLKEQQPSFPQLSSLLQKEFEASLKDTKRLVKKLLKESKLTKLEIALNIITSSSLDKVFAISDETPSDTHVAYRQDPSVGAGLKN